MLIALIISGIVTGVCAWETSGYQTGVAIGAWMTAVQALTFAVVFLWWS